MTKVTRPSEDRDDEIERRLYEHMRKQGQLIPGTPEEVEAAEKWLAKQSIQLPETLRKHKSESCAPHRVLTFPTATNQATQGLARAAREGKAVPPEIEEQMKKDREQKEREAKGGI